MKISLLNKGLSALLLIIMILAVFVRENIFLEVNAILNGYEYNKAYFYFFDESLSQLTSSQLILLKWLLSFLFIVFVASCTFAIIKLWFNNMSYNRLVLYAYGALIVIALLCYGILHLFNVYNDYYFILRKILGLAHSPIPLFIFFALFYFLDKKELFN